MTDQGRQPSLGGNESCLNKQELDLRDPARYMASIEWLRNNVVLGIAKELVLQLNVSLPNGTTTLFMDLANHYIMGFRGADKIYVLEDNKSEAFRKSLQSQLGNTPVEILRGLGADHGLRGLQTFSRGNGGIRGRIFKRADLDSAVTLSSYSSETRNINYDDLRSHLSLLVCMISESARMPMMERDFANMLYYGYDVWADEAIRSFDDAKFLITLALETFPSYPRHLAVEKLEKRATELRSLLSKIESQAGSHNRSKLVAGLIAGEIASPASVVDAINRFRAMCKELKIVDPNTISQMISTCSSEGAVRAAKQGVAIPDIDRTLQTRIPRVGLKSTT